MLFQHIRYRLLSSYVAVLSVILGAFAIAVRIVFIHNLTHELTEELTTIAQAAATDIEADDGKLMVTDDEVLVSNGQAVQWFDIQGNLIGQQGSFVIALPFNPKARVQTQTTPLGIQAITVPVFDNGTELLIGYVRVSESMTELNDTVRRLDWGLGGGVILSLALSGIGSIWLTCQAMQPIERSFRKLQQFTADASHELRSPLMAIKSNAAVALKYLEGMRELDAEKFQAIASATAQMSALTEDLLMLARTDQSLPNQQEAVNLKPLLVQLIQLYQPQVETKQIHLQVNWVVELLYWTAILFSNTLGTALGDFLADSSGLGFAGGALLIASLLALVLAAHYYTQMSKVMLFWVAFVLTRPFGATLGDVLTKAHEKGGLAFGTIGSSIVLLSILGVCILFTTLKQRRLIVPMSSNNE
jgi:hypothetical protein